MTKKTPDSEDTLLIVSSMATAKDNDIHSVTAALPYRRISCISVKHAKQRLREFVPTLIIYEWQSSDHSGTTFIKWLRTHCDLRHVPVVVVSHHDDEEQLVAALESGADDYLALPSTDRKLGAHIRAILRRGPLLTTDTWLHRGKLRFNVQTHQVYYCDCQLVLTPTEYKLLRHLAIYEGKIQSRQQLMTQVWGNSHFLDERSVDVQIKRLRAKFRPYGAETMIRTIRGFGYVFTRPDEKLTPSSTGTSG